MKNQALNLFLSTGLPEAYSLFKHSETAKKAVDEDKNPRADIVTDKLQGIG